MTLGGAARARVSVWRLSIADSSGRDSAGTAEVWNLTEAIILARKLAWLVGTIRTAGPDTASAVTTYTGGLGYFPARVFGSSAGIPPPLAVLSIDLGSIQFRSRAPILTGVFCLLVKFPLTVPFDELVNCETVRSFVPLTSWRYGFRFTLRTEARVLFVTKQTTQQAIAAVLRDRGVTVTDAGRIWSR